jgi:hypothetical protein
MATTLVTALIMCGWHVNLKFEFDNNGQLSVKLWLVDLESMLDEDQECGGSFIKRVEGLETMMVATKKHDIARWNLIVAFVEANGLSNHSVRWPRDDQSASSKSN